MANNKLSLFTYYFPMDNNAYLWSKIRYRIDNHGSVEIGGNVFPGKDNHTLHILVPDTVSEYPEIPDPF